MEIGFLTACLRGMPFDELVAWAAGEGFAFIELAAWPVGSRRSTEAGPFDVANLTSDQAARAREVLAEHGVSISAMAYYENNLHPDRSRRRRHHIHLRKVIDAAEMLEVPLVGTFVGASSDLPPVIIRDAGILFRNLVSYASDRGVRLMIENCPMENWVRWGLPGNYAYSPELWDALFHEVPELGLNFDPSHLYWLHIDHLRAVRDYASRIYHVHAKDAELVSDGTYRFGVLAEQLRGNPWRSGWWRYRMPGRGGVDWRAFVEVLREARYRGGLSIEHEDPEYEGTEEKVKEGLRLGRRHLAGVVDEIGSG
jgi:sugar phosphate isomerase/epimerase